ncbi:TetR family transcriptional regulator [Pseudofrankia sp. BMG5.37]|uniref:TetR/AcrR family transcriptional regulator n=1 Tax=Pseudofrankia sp. BMG5.37 TaxID=3050035 RepID=UPI0028938678|nr:TetR family transcriptional regulator [Pseudofrankia sp. BMG5.37]MDT3443451.1 TetR family transcriptional regulator [Pseudofrankia sp. BMG5.37]
MDRVERAARGGAEATVTPTTRRRDARRSRERLLAAAAELFAERGYAGTSLRAVAERAGVDAALVARYYGGKDGLYRAVLAADPVVSPVVDESDEGHEADDEARRRAADELAGLLARMVDRWENGPATTVGQNVFRCDLDDAAAAATAERVGERVLPLLRAAAEPPGGPDSELRAELATVVLLGIGVARTAGTLPALAAADPEELGVYARALLDTVLGRR